MADHKFSLIYSKGFIGDIKKLTWARVRHNKKVVYRYKNKQLRKKKIKSDQRQFKGIEFLVNLFDSKESD